jgi:hypothetical protein
LIRVLPFACAALVALGCNASLADVEVDVVSVEVNLSATAWAPGDTVDVTVTVTNLLKRAINYSNSACPLTVELIGGGGQEPARLTGWGCILLQSQHVLGHYASDEHTYRFHGMAWQPASPLARPEWVELEPGTYDIVAEIDGTILRSEPVAIEILAP